MAWLNHNASGIQAVATVVLVLLTGAYATVTFFLSKHAREQIRVTARSSDAQTMLRVIDQLQAEYVRAARRTVQARLSTSASGPWSTEEEDAAAVVCATYDAVAMLVATEMIDEEPFTTNWAPSLVRCYLACRPFIMRVREESGEAYWENFEEAALQAKDRVKFPDGLLRSGGTDEVLGPPPATASGANRVQDDD